MATLLSERGAQATWRDYLELTKPKVVLLILLRPRATRPTATVTVGTVTDGPSSSR